MAAIIALAVALDGLTPPTTLTLNPVGINDKNIAVWKSDESVYDARSTLTSSLRLPSKNQKVARHFQKFTMPIMAEDGLTQAGEFIFNGECVIPKNSTAEQRAHFMTAIGSLIFASPVQDAVKDLEGTY